MENIEQGREDGGVGGKVWGCNEYPKTISLRRHVSRDLKQESEQ